MFHPTKHTHPPSRRQLSNFSYKKESNKLFIVKRCERLQSISSKSKSIRFFQKTSFLIFWLDRNSNIPAPSGIFPFYHYCTIIGGQKHLKLFFYVWNYLRLGILFPLTKFEEGSLEINVADRERCASPVSRLLCMSWNFNK